MRLYVIFCIALISLCTVEAAGRKKIVSSKKPLETKSTPEITTTESTKSVEKPTYPKKVISVKKRPTKSPNLAGQPKDVTEIFKNLPEDDFAFIQELDKQFKLHGSKLKIKVERENITETGKNSKRTIEGELGYGYEHNGYTYERPKFMFYPYSQHDIPSDAPAYYPQYETASVTVEPSYSYELKPQTYVVHHPAPPQPQIDVPQENQGSYIEEQQQQSHQQQAHEQSQGNYNEPVIVLRIPGPTKYASHLQALLQQYLEIRAAQYLRILEETEARKQQEQGQHYSQGSEEQAPAQHYEQQQPSAEAAPQENYNLDLPYQQHSAPTPQPISYPDIQDVYQTYKGRQHYQQQQQQQQHQQQNEYPNEHDYSQVSQVPQQYYYPNEPQLQHENQHQQQEQQEQQQQQQQIHPGYQQIYVIAMAPSGYADASQQYALPQHPIYVEEEEQHAANQAVYAPEHEPHLPTTENNPRDSHTKIYYTQGHEQGSPDHADNSYPLPSIKPYDRLPSRPSAFYHQQYQREIAGNYQHQQSSSVESAVAVAPHHQETVTITQRPYNYHAHPSRRSKGGRKRASASSPSTTTKVPTTAGLKTSDETEQKLQKIRKFVHENLGAKMASAVEITTTQID